MLLKIAYLGEWNAAAREEGVCWDFCAQEGEGERDGGEGGAFLKSYKFCHFTYMLQVKKFTNVYVKNFGENQPEEKLEEVFSKFGIITSYKLVSIFHRSSPFFTEHVQVKDRNLSEKEDDDEGGVENSGDSKNKGFGFVSFQAS